MKRISFVIVSMSIGQLSAFKSGVDEMILWRIRMVWGIEIGLSYRVMRRGEEK